MKTQPQISITTLLYNSADCIRECLQSIQADVQSGFAELLVVDNASPDDSAGIVAQEFPEAKLIRSEMNRGFAGGCNLAWPHAQGRYWLLLNPDVVVPEGGLRKLVKWMDQHPDVGAASPRIVNSDGQPASAANRFPSIPRLLLEVSRLHLILPARQRGLLLLGSYWSGEDCVDVDWVHGTVLISRREAVTEAGLLSEHFFMYGEDMEWCWRIRRANWKIGLCGGVVVSHSVGTSAKRTWGKAGHRQRVLQASYEACWQIRGSFYSQALLIVNAISLATESYNPRRSKEARSRAREALHDHLDLLRRGWASEHPLR